MQEKFYTVTRIEGEYAYLKEKDSHTEEELFIAMALLPMGSDVGATLLYKDLEFTLLI